MSAVSVILAITVTVVMLFTAVTAYFALATRRIARQAEKLVPPSEKFVEVEGNRIYFVDEGEGRPILFIHGLGGHLHQLRHPLFDHFGPSYRLIALDRPGSNYSTRLEKFTGRIPEQARFMAGFIEKLGLDKPLLVGHSLGGAVALAVALDHPDRVSGLALISPYTHHNEELPAEFSNLQISSRLLRKFVAHTFAAPLAVRNAKAVLDFVFGPQQPPKDYAIEGGALALLRPQHFYGTSTDAMAMEKDMPHQQERYSGIRLPVGILFGSADRVLDYRKHGLQMAEKLPGVDLEILEGVGHMPQYAQPERVIAFMRRTAARAFAA